MSAEKLMHLMKRIPLTVIFLWKSQTFNKILLMKNKQCLIAGLWRQLKWIWILWSTTKSVINALNLAKVDPIKNLNVHSEVPLVIFFSFQSPIKNLMLSQLLLRIYPSSLGPIKNLMWSQLLLGIYPSSPGPIRNLVWSQRYH